METSGAAQQKSPTEEVPREVEATQQRDKTPPNITTARKESPKERRMAIIPKKPRKLDPNFHIKRTIDFTVSPSDPIFRRTKPQSGAGKGAIILRTVRRTNSTHPEIVLHHFGHIGVLEGNVKFNFVNDKYRQSAEAIWHNRTQRLGAENTNVTASLMHRRAQQFWDENKKKVGATACLKAIYILADSTVHEHNFRPAGSLCYRCRLIDEMEMIDEVRPRQLPSKDSADFTKFRADTEYSSEVEQDQADLWDLRESLRAQGKWDEAASQDWEAQWRAKIGSDPASRDLAERMEVAGDPKVRDDPIFRPYEESYDDIGLGTGDLVDVETDLTDPVPILETPPKSVRFHSSPPKKRNPGSLRTVPKLKRRRQKFQEAMKRRRRQLDLRVWAANTLREALRAANRAQRAAEAVARRLKQLLDQESAVFEWIDTDETDDDDDSALDFSPGPLNA